MRVIIAYDIAAPRRLRSVAKAMEDVGVRVQKSIFEMEGSESDVLAMMDRARDIMDFSEDSIKVFRLCERCAGKCEIIGVGSIVERDSPYIVL